MGKTIKGVALVASTCKCARVVDAAVVTGPIQRAFIHIWNGQKERRDKTILGDKWKKHISNNTITDEPTLSEMLSLIPTCVE